MAPVLTTAKEFERHQRQIAAMVERSKGPYLRAIRGGTAQKQDAAPPLNGSAGHLPVPTPVGTVHAAPVFDASPAPI
jgi:hypothetical protein